MIKKFHNKYICSLFIYFHQLFILKVFKKEQATQIILFFKILKNGEIKPDLQVLFIISIFGVNTLVSALRKAPMPKILILIKTKICGIISLLFSFHYAATGQFQIESYILFVFTKRLDIVLHRHGLILNSL